MAGGFFFSLGNLYRNFKHVFVLSSCFLCFSDICLNKFATLWRIEGVLEISFDLTEIANNAKNNEQTRRRVYVNFTR